MSVTVIEYQVSYIDKYIMNLCGKNTDGRRAVKQTRERKSLWKDLSSCFR